MSAIIHAHPSLTLPPGWTWGAYANRDMESWYALHDSGVSAIVVHRPDYESGPEEQEEFEAALLDLEPELDLEAAEPAFRALERLAAE